jgi:hypothetical protein
MQPMLRSYTLQVLMERVSKLRIWSWVPDTKEDCPTDHQLKHNFSSVMTALVKPSSSCKLQTHPLVREGAPHQQSRMGA